MMGTRALGVDKAEEDEIGGHTWNGSLSRVSLFGR